MGTIVEAIIVSIYGSTYESMAICAYNYSYVGETGGVLPMFKGHIVHFGGVCDIVSTRGLVFNNCPDALEVAIFVVGSFLWN